MWDKCLSYVSLWQSNCTIFDLVKWFHILLPYVVYVHHLQVKNVVNSNDF